MRAFRAGSVMLALLALAALPLGWAALSDAGLAGSVALAVAGFLAALDAVGWVFVPQAVLAVEVRQGQVEAADRVAGERVEVAEQRLRRRALRCSAGERREGEARREPAPHVHHPYQVSAVEPAARASSQTRAAARRVPCRAPSPTPSA